MKYPKLVPNAVCTTPIEITIYQEGITEDGSPQEAIKMTTKCNYQDSASRVYTTNKESVQIAGRCYINDDVAPLLSVISGGEVVINGMRREIVRGTKARNIDGTVNYTLLEVR